MALGLTKNMRVAESGLKSHQYVNQAINDRQPKQYNRIFYACVQNCKLYKLHVSHFSGAQFIRCGVLIYATSNVTRNACEFY